MDNIHIFFALNNDYTQHCCASVVSILENNPDFFFDFYLLSDYISPENKQKLASLSRRYSHFEIHYPDIDDSPFRNFALNINYISLQTYYRYAIAEWYPQLDKAIYLDCDLIVNGSLKEIWETDITDYLCAGVSDLWIENIYYKPEINFSHEELYINAGALLLNLKKMREEQTYRALCQATAQPPCKIKFQDQDIINLVCRGKIKELPEKFNFTTENAIKHPEERDKAVIIHYTGRAKPWSVRNCPHPQSRLYFDYLEKTPYKSHIQSSIIFKKITKLFTHKKQNPNRPIRVALLIDEFFGGAGTAFGGYGFLARHYIAKYLPCDDIQIDVLLGLNQKKKCKRAVKTRVDNVYVYTLPGRKHASKWFKKQNYDLYFSIELTTSFLQYEKDKNKRLLLWVQDPRPWKDWLEIQTVKLFPESCYWNTQVYELVHKLYTENRVTFVTQGRFLIEKARCLYRLSPETPIAYLPNPVDIDPHFDVKTYPKKNHIIFIGRIESVKRGWLFCEIAKRMPEYQFYMLGQSFREKSQNESIMKQYRTGIENLHFTGHVEGEEKFKYIKDAKILVNTSIHEALPVTFLEALAYGTLLVSCQNPENLPEKFGSYTGPVLGDGFDKIDLFVNAIRSLIKNEEKRKELSIAGYEYVKQIHNVSDFIRNTRALIRKEAHK